MFLERYRATGQHRPESMGLFTARARILYTERMGRQPADPHEWLEAASLAYKDALPFNEDDLADMLDELV